MAMVHAHQVDKHEVNVVDLKSKTEPHTISLGDEYLAALF